MALKLVADMLCTICGTKRDLDRHHVTPRGMGGSKEPTVLADNNLMTLCRTCHRNIHEGAWTLEHSPSLVRVVDRRNGTEIMRRYRDPNFDAGRFLGALNLMESSLVAALGGVIYLNDEQLVDAFQASRSIGKRAWLIQAAILYEAQRRSVYGDRSLEAIARRFEISLRQAQKCALVWQVFFATDRTGDEHGETKSVNVDAFSLEEPSWYVVAATESPEPERWLAYAQDKKAESPRYSISDFRGDIQRAGGAAIRVLEETTDPAPDPAPRIPWDCPWVKPYCTRSWRPSPAEQCRCEEQADIDDGKTTER